MKEPASTTSDSSAQMDALVRARYHGAANISGIKYQMLYSTLRAMDLCDDSTGVQAVVLERIEDLDVLDIHVGSTYIQVKSSKTPWSWLQLREPMESFIKVMRADQDARFELVVDFALQGSILKLAKIGELPKKEKAQVQKLLRNLCKNLDASASEAEQLAGRLTITSLPEERVWQLLRKAASRAFHLSSDAVDIYAKVLLAHAVDWAESRHSVVRADIDRVYGDTSEKLARQTDFDAYGEGLISRVSWEPDANPLDFFEGKGTRPGHIAAGVDVVRHEWMRRIGEVLDRNNVCVIRSSSGQGKSTLAYRYARTQWAVEDIFIVRVAREPEQVERILNYIDFQCSLGVPILVLVDGADWRTSQWPAIAQGAMSKGAYVLVTIRMEDWHRFSREGSLTYGLIEPHLGIEEAKEVFQSFQKQGRIHPNVHSAEWAYEKIGDAHLLMEYVYLITHGQMLQERLSDQIKAFGVLHEDAAKIEILRRIAVADSFGVSVDIRRLLDTVNLANDPQQVLASLVGEYVTSEDGQFRGLHQVRSEHLVELLHGDFPSLTDTTVKVLDAIPLESIATFVRSALSCGRVDRKPFLAALVQKTLESGIPSALAILEGLFQGGEMYTLRLNQDLFDAAFDLAGTAGPLLLSLKFAPGRPLDTIDEMIGILGDSREKAGAFPALRDLSCKFRSGERGLDLCTELLAEVCARIPLDTLLSGLDCLGRFLDWCAFCGMSIATWPDASGTIAESIFDLDLPGVSSKLCFCPLQLCQPTTGLTRSGKLTASCASI